MATVGVVGVGYWGPNFVRVLDELPEASLKWVCDKDASRFDKISKIYPHLKLTTDYGDLLNDSELEAVVVATSSDTHHAIGSEVLAAGKHLLVEKPLAMSHVQGKEMVDLAEKNDRILMVGHLLRYHGAYQALRGYLEDGSLGKLHYLYCTRVNLGKVRRTENALWSFAPHDISVVLYLVGAMPTSVVAVGRSYLREGVEDVGFIVLEFPEEVVAHIHVSWLDPHKVRRTTVVGSKKMAVLDDTEVTEKVRVYDKGVSYTPSYGDYGESLTIRVGDIWIPKLDLLEPLRVECQHFLSCVNNGEAPLTGGEDGLRVLRVLEAADESMKGHGSRVMIE
ncbi:MAG: Gfo/Idh/MocA family oxidoreductase [Candidatus Eisenbacteria sp.]|nr:Gfo/Idh/MocA family oxidoreductase [Candidatus Eisenbacteria bacterium]